VAPPTALPAAESSSLVNMRARCLMVDRGTSSEYTFTDRCFNRGGWEDSKAY
jgi:hypothetical protein